MQTHVLTAYRAYISGDNVTPRLTPKEIMTNYFFETVLIYIRAQAKVYKNNRSKNAFLELPGSSSGYFIDKLHKRI